ncbi:MAG: hypothetical protein QOH24_2418 [Verrucomicrobiota bacterium]
MKHRSMPQRSQGGSVVLFVIILLAVIGGGWYALSNLRRNSEVEGQQFAREVIERVAVQHDGRYLHSIVPADRRIAFPPATEQGFIDGFTKLGAPDRNFALEGNFTFESYFFSPQGTFKAILTYPDRHATIFVSIAKPSGYWVLRDLAVTWERPPE